MEIKQALNLNFEKDSVVTIGTFDGVHIGHQKIINRLVKIAKKNDLQAVVLTFFPHPRMVLQQDSSLKLINTIDEKSMLLERFGIDHLVIKRFTKDFSRLPALEFVRDILVNKIKTKFIIIGYDHHFGRNRAANIDDLREFGETYDFKVIEISAQEIDDVAVSSTKIRRAIEKGDIKVANSYLGYNFMLTGRVIKGMGRGKTLNFPTANLLLKEAYKLRPKNGVYVISSTIDEVVYYGMMNIGTNPTFNTSKAEFIEINFFDFEQDIYDLELQVEIIDRLRNEKKFDSAEALKAQLILDKEMALICISNYHA